MNIFSGADMVGPGAAVLMRMCNSAEVSVIIVAYEYCYQLISCNAARGSAGV